MNRRRELALLSLTTVGLLGSGCLGAQETSADWEDMPGRYSYSQAVTFDNNLTPSQQDFYDSLSDRGQQMYLSLDQQGRNLAVEIHNDPDMAVQIVRQMRGNQMGLLHSSEASK